MSLPLESSTLDLSSASSVCSIRLCRHCHSQGDLGLTHNWKKSGEWFTQTNYNFQNILHISECLKAILIVTMASRINRTAKQAARYNFTWPRAHKSVGNGCAEAKMV